MNLKPSQIVLLVSGLLVVIFSFLTFNQPDMSGDERKAVEEYCEDSDDAMCDQLDGWSAWTGTDLDEGDGGFAPLSIWPVLLALVVAGATAATAFGNVNLPDNILGFTTKQLLGALSLIAFLIMFGLLIGGASGLFETSGADGDDSGIGWGIGFWLMLLGSAGLVAGSVMDLKDESPSPVGGSPNQPSTPF